MNANIDMIRQAARQAASGGNRAAAGERWAEVLNLAPADAEAANALGNIRLGEGRAADARSLFERAVQSDPRQPALLFNLAAACKASGDRAASLDALERALAIEPYFIQAIFQKALLFEEAGKTRDAANIFRDFLATVPPEVEADPRFAAPLAHAREVVAKDDGSLSAAVAALGEAPSRNVAACVAHLTGQAPIYRSEPTFLHVPELPSIPFFERAATPWLDELEAAFPMVLAEAQQVFDAGVGGFVPYVANAPGTPLNQWDKLDHNTDWGAFFLWKHGARNEGNAARMPQTTALLERLPRMTIPGRGPSAFLSRLAPHTRIPPHNGVTNARVTVHLPLIVPPGCGFRVGPERREWVPGTAWVFDDTIDHEAWNDSPEPRLILIFDVWNPLLSAAECDHLSRVLGEYDRHYGRKAGPTDEF